MERVLRCTHARTYVSRSIAALPARILQQMPHVAVGSAPPRQPRLVPLLLRKRRGSLGARHVCMLYPGVGGCGEPDPSMAAVPFWGQSSQSPSSLPPKRDCGSKRVNPLGRSERDTVEYETKSAEYGNQPQQALRVSSARG